VNWAAAALGATAIANSAGYWVRSSCVARAQLPKHRAAAPPLREQP
jgi:hypothetical protein